ncbi:thioredoxin family protein [Adhaeribacter sp. BT258]|uniref:Thioredoxin family protein n=1 Tax=Adhaeribacter terrigena TaxID=2793070 RepID=A0ABS1BWM0_9BACT|nr:thioredoxin family protein [Adhaeribacter terrigena]MBK0401531.1 thioredoxin family protein [Adhaeribacter terrigena]
METNKTLDLTAEAKKYTYAEYKAGTEKQVNEGMCATPELLEYTKLNLQRMKRLDKTVSLRPEVTEALEKLNRKLQWVVISEGWCGDAAQNVPVLAKIAEASEGKITLEFVLRDQNLELMDLYLTNGGRSIPKLICFDADTQEELGTWGPRPAAAQEMFIRLKNEGVPKDEFISAVHTWYSNDKTQSMQMECAELLENCNR